MEKFIEKFVGRILEEKFPLFEVAEVTSERNYLRYNVFLTIDFIPYLMNYIEIFSEIKNTISDTIKMFGIKNEIKIFLNFSD